MNTKFLKIAICTVFLGVPLGLRGDDGLADNAAAGIVLASVSTTTGKTYRDVELISADAHGLMFRHDRGVAKVDFDDLSENLREMFQVEPEPEPESDLIQGGKGDGADEAAPDGEVEIDGVLEIVTHTRVVITLPPNYGPGSHGPYHACNNPCSPSRVPYLSHWARYHPGLALSRADCRAAATRDFLISSGLIPTPPGVVVRRWRY